MPARRARTGFRKFSPCIARTRDARGALAGLTVYLPIRDVASPLARRDHRKSKFGLRHGIKLNSLCAGAQTAVPVSTFSECVYTQQQPIVRRRILSGTSYIDFISLTNP